jgi:hypothetical protein
MSDKKTAPVIDWALHSRNRAKWTADALRPYAGQFIAWSLEGDRIVAHDADLVEMDRQVQALGLSTEEVLLEQLPPADRFEELL